MTGFDPAKCPRCNGAQDRPGIAPCLRCMSEIADWVDEQRRAMKRKAVAKGNVEHE